MLLKSIFTSLALGLFMFSATANADIKEPYDNARNEIRKYIAHLDIELPNDAEKVLTINFMLNVDNEIIILSTSDKALDDAIKAGLNYKKMKSKALVQNQVYNLPIRLSYISFQ